MPQPIKPKYCSLDLKAHAYSLTGAIFLLFTLIAWGPSPLATSFRVLQDNSLQFFVRCITNDCSSLITPFIAYLLNLGNNLWQLFILWLVINTGLSAYLFLQLTKTSVKAKHAFAIASIPFVLVALNKFNPSPLITILPCILSVLIASLLHYQGEKNWVYFITGAALFNLPMGLLLFCSLVCYLMYAKDGKQARRDMVQIVISISLACAIIILYLLLIESNFLEWGNLGEHQESFSNPISTITALALSYLTVFIALTNIHVKKII